MLGSDGSIDARPWRRVVCAGMVIDDAGLAFRDGPLMSRMVDRTLALEDDRERVTALLSVAYRRPVSEASIEHIDAAADYWRRGDKALANLRLVFAGLPRLEEAGDLARLRAAEWLLDQGLAPRVLMKELGLDPVTHDLAKYDPDQPRVPAGHGRESGRWGDDAGISDPPGAEVKPGPHQVQVAANGPLTPGGIDVVPLPGVDPLDPKGLNTPLSPAEQQIIADTINTIIGAKPEDISTLRPHPYKNFPHDTTGAQLPISDHYTSYYIRSPGSAPGIMRLITGDGHIYYSNNHYESFYPVDIIINSNRK